MDGEAIEARARGLLVAAIRAQGDSAQSADGIEQGRDHAVWGNVAIRAIIAALTGREEIVRETVERCARIAEESATGNSRMERHYLASAEREVSTAGRQVDLESAVGFAKRASGASAIATAIRALAPPRTLSSPDEGVGK